MASSTSGRDPRRPVIDAMFTIFPRPWLDHHPAGGLRAQEDAGEVDVDDLLPAVQRRVLRRGRPRPCRRCSPGRRCGRSAAMGRGHQPLDVVGLRHVARKPRHATPCVRSSSARPRRSARRCARRARRSRPARPGHRPSAGRGRCRRR